MPEAARDFPGSPDGNPDERGRDLEALGHDPKELEQPLRQRPVDDAVSQVGEHYVQPVDEDDPGAERYAVDVTHVPGTAKPRPDDHAPRQPGEDVPAPALDLGESPDGREQYARPNIVEPPYGGAR